MQQFVFDPAIWINIAMYFVKCIAFIAFLSHKLALAEFNDENEFYFDDGSEVLFLPTEKKIIYFRIL